MGNFTQGPWRAVKAPHGFIDIFDNRNRDIVTIYGGGVDPADKNFNALLIASAPDLYNALWEAVELSDRTLPPSGRTPECQRVYDLCRAALKKAEGN